MPEDTLSHQPEPETPQIPQPEILPSQPEPTPEKSSTSTPQTSSTPTEPESEVAGEETAQPEFDSPVVEPETETEVETPQVEGSVYKHKKDPVFADVADMVLPQTDQMKPNGDNRVEGSVVFGVSGYTGLWKNPNAILRDEILEEIFIEIFSPFKLAFLKDLGIICQCIKPYLSLRKRDATRAIQYAIHMEGSCKTGMPGHLDGVDGLFGDKTLGAFKNIMLSDNEETFLRLLDLETYYKLRDMAKSDSAMYENTLKSYSK